MASLSASSSFSTLSETHVRAPGELRLIVMARLAPTLRHDLNNLMTVLKLDLSGARAKARRAALDAARVAALLDSLQDGIARIGEAQTRLLAWFDAAPATAAVGPTLAELADLLHGPCSMRGRALVVAAQALERNAGADRHALRLLVTAALLAIVDGAWTGAGGIELDADTRGGNIVIALRRGSSGADTPGMPTPPVAAEQRLTLDDVDALARDCGWSLACADDELWLSGPLA